MTATEFSPTLDARPGETPQAENQAASALVRGAGRMAKLLISASPKGARVFAVSMHERVRGEDSDASLVFWTVVLDMVIAHERPPRKPN